VVGVVDELLGEVVPVASLLPLLPGDAELVAVAAELRSAGPG
jgi:hypothetical protein